MFHSQVAEVVAALDVNKDGLVSFEELVAAVEADPRILDTLSRVFAQVWLCG